MEQIFSCYGSNHYDTGEKQAQKHAAGEFKGLFFLLLLFCCWFMIKILYKYVFSNLRKQRKQQRYPTLLALLP